MAEATDPDNDDMSYSAECIKQLLECSICFERFQNPKLLPCHHTFCQNCLEELVITENNLQTILCPQCRASHILSNHRVMDLPNNFTIISLLDLSPNVSRASPRSDPISACVGCATETCQSDLACCAHCNDILCPICLKSHFTQLRSSLIKSGKQIRVGVEDISDEIHKITGVLSQIKHKCDGVKIEIAKSVKNCVTELLERQNGLCHDVDAYLNKTSSGIQADIEALEANLASRLSFSASFDSVLATKPISIQSSIESLMTISAQSSVYDNGPNYRSLFSGIHSETDVHINFVPTNSQQMSQCMLKFGEIVTEAPTCSINSEANKRNSASEMIPRNCYQEKGSAHLSIGQEGSPRYNFNNPCGVAVSSAGGWIYITDSGNHRVHIFDDSGAFIKTFGSHGHGQVKFNFPTGVAVNSHDEILISDCCNHRIVVLDRDGAFKYSFCERGSDNGQLLFPWSVAVDNLDNIYVCDKDNDRVQVFQRNGTFIRMFGQSGRGHGELAYPAYVAVSPDTNRVYVADCNSHRVQVFSKQGKFISLFGTQGMGNGQMNSPRGMAIDEQGFIILADSFNHRVQVFSEDCKFFCTFGNHGTGSGDFNSPCDVAISSNGSVIVVDSGNNRVQIF